MRKGFSTTPNAYAVKRAERKDFKDSYAYNHAKQRKEANVSRQAVLKQQRAEAMGTPIRGITTPFLESFDTALPTPIQPGPSPTNAENQSEAATYAILEPAEEVKYLNNFVTKHELHKSIKFSRLLTEPIASGPRETRDPEKEAQEIHEHEAYHRNAVEVLNRIVNVSNSSSKDRTRINVQRIIDTFGRHNTDQHLKPKAPSPMSKDVAICHAEPTPRAGPDVGSSEVQIGILTAKIRLLADRYEGENRMDKANKRNLRLLLHRRQKLLKYMFRRERGSERWHNLVQKLGLTEATWRGQIEVR